METHKTQNVTDKTTEIKETEEEAGEKNGHSNHQK